MRRVSYSPFSKDLSHPGDRRRIGIWSDYYNIPINLGPFSSDDVLVLSSASSLKSWAKKHEGPVVIDLVDGYLSGKPPLIEDFLRNGLRSFYKMSSFSSITFSRELIEALQAADAVVVSCPEQAQAIESLNDNIYCILDDHSELVKTHYEVNSQSESPFTIVWEGMGYTLKHLLDLSEELETLILTTQARLIVVTNSSFKKYAGKFGHKEVKDMLLRRFNRVWASIELVDWSIENLKEATSRADVAIIPIDLGDEFARAKPENKLLSFWTLGLPVICSPTPAYRRVLSSIDQSYFLSERGEWCKKLREIAQFKLEDPTFLSKMRYGGLSYIDQFHTKSILAKKWDSVLRPFLTK